MAADLMASMTIEGSTPDAGGPTRSRHPLWVIPSRRSKEPRWGSMFCQACLAEDAEPYFRLRWRMAYEFSCAKHQLWLRDRCPVCGYAPWPTGSSVKVALSPAYTSHARCWSCGFDLRQPTDQTYCDLGDLNDDVPSGMRKKLADRVAPDTTDQDLLRGLHALCQLNVRTRELFFDHRRNSTEMYSIEIRRDLLRQAFAWLCDWPKVFIEEVTALGLTRASFNGHYASLPSWIRVVVDGGLARQNRSVSKETARQTFLTLQSDLGRHPSQADMRRVLGEAGDRHVRALVKKRTVLSAEEIALMHQRAGELQIAAHRRSDMLHSFRKGALGLSLSAHTNMTLKNVSEVSAAELLEIVQTTPAFLTGWLFGNAAVETDQVESLLMGSARQLLKLSRNYMRSLLEPLPDDILCNEAVIRFALNRAGES